MPQVKWTSHSDFSLEISRGKIYHIFTCYRLVVLSEHVVEYSHFLPENEVINLAIVGSVLYLLENASVLIPKLERSLSKMLVIAPKNSAIHINIGGVPASSLFFTSVYAAQTPDNVFGDSLVLCAKRAS